MIVGIHLFPKKGCSIFLKNGALILEEDVVTLFWKPLSLHILHSYTPTDCSTIPVIASLQKEPEYILFHAYVMINLF